VEIVLGVIGVIGIIVVGVAVGIALYWLINRKRGIHGNWRLWSPYHFWTNGDNGYFAWLSRKDPDWWKKYLMR